MTGRDRPHPARRSRLFVILASGINSHEAALRRAYNDERHTRAHLDVPLSREELREYDLEIAHHKAGKGALSARLEFASLRLASRLRAFEYLFVWTNTGHMPGLHDHIICSAPSLHRVVVPRRIQWTLCFHFGSTHQPPRSPFSPCYRHRLSFSLPFSFSTFLFRFGRVFLISSISPLSPKPTALLSFLHFPQARERHFDISAFSRRRVRPRERTAVTSAALFCFALRAVEPFAIVTATSSMEGFVSRVSYGSLLE